MHLRLLIELAGTSRWSRPQAVLQLGRAARVAAAALAATVTHPCTGSTLHGARNSPAFPARPPARHSTPVRPGHRRGILHCIAAGPRSDPRPTIGRSRSRVPAVGHTRRARALSVAHQFTGQFAGVLLHKLLHQPSVQHTRRRARARRPTAAAALPASGAPRPPYRAAFSRTQMNSLSSPVRSK